MHVSKFSNDLNDANVQDSGLAAQNLQEVAASAPESFTNRMEVEESRKVIARYTDSLVARGPAGLDIRSNYARRKQALQKRATTVPDRQAFNAANLGAPGAVPGQPDASASQRTFQEPPSRGYNPYA